MGSKLTMWLVQAFGRSFVSFLSISLCLEYPINQCCGLIMNHNYLLRCEQKIWFSWAVYNFPFTSPLIFEPKNKWKTSKPHRFSWRFFPCQLHPLVKRLLFKAPCEPQPSVWLSVGSSWPANLCKLCRELGGEVVKGKETRLLLMLHGGCCWWWMMDGGWRWQDTFQLNSAFAKSMDQWCQERRMLSSDTQWSCYAKFFSRKQVLIQELLILQLADLRIGSPKGWRCDMMWLSHPKHFWPIDFLGPQSKQLDTCRPFSSSLFVPERLSVGKEHCWVHRWKDWL